MITVEQVVQLARRHEYMCGVERDKGRVKQTAEVFTPTALVQEVLDHLPLDIVWTDTMLYAYFKLEPEEIDYVESQT